MDWLTKEKLAIQWGHLARRQIARGTGIPGETHSKPYPIPRRLDRIVGLLEKTGLERKLVVMIKINAS